MTSLAQGLCSGNKMDYEYNVESDQESNPGPLNLAC